MPTSSLWSESAPAARHVELQQNLQVDTIVIGGGIMGVTAAYLLKKAGKKIALIEREKIASVDTGHTTAHLTYVTDKSLTDLAAKFGEAGAKALWRSGQIGINQIKKIIDEVQIDCDFGVVPGYLHVWDKTDDAGIERLRKDAALAGRIGFEAEYMDRIPFFSMPGVRFPNQARFHPLKYIAALLKKIGGDGSVILDETEAGEFSKEPLGVRVGAYKIEAGDIVIATHSPLMGNAGVIGSALFQTKLSLYTSYAIGASIPRGLIPDCLFWDTRDPYGYLRIQPGKTTDYIVYGGKDHKTGQEENPSAVFADLERELLDIVPDVTLARRWSGQVIETVDGAPYIGETAPHQFVGTGFSGNGMTFGTVAAMMARDSVLGLTNPWTELFSPSRKSLGSAVTYLKENFDYPYYLVKDRIEPEEEGSPDSLAPGEGKVLRIDGKRVAIYRDDSGSLLKLSPVCTHLGCIVNWNNVERTWECPCHGSRFQPTGEVLAGPAESPLEKLND